MYSRPKTSLAWVFLILVLLPSAGTALITESDVEREAERVFQQMKATIPISRDAEARAYVECVARAILSALDEPYRSLPWEIELFEHRSANAFAMPGGKIGVLTGIFRVAQDQHSLAAVIGHEIAHVLERHSLKRARRQLRNRLLVIAASGVIDGGRAADHALGVGAEIGLNLPYDRKQETEADTEGLELMSRAGFDPRASLRLWKNMSRQNPRSPPEFLSTHPAAEGRIDALIAQLTPSLILFNEANDLGRAPQCR